MLFETVLDAEFWTKVVGCAVAILISIPVLVFVRKNERNFGKSLKKKFDAIDRKFEKLLKQNTLSRGDLLDVARRLNALYKTAQQAAYEEDNYGFDRVKTLLGDAREEFSDYRLFKTAEPSLMRERLEDAKMLTSEAETQLAHALENASRVRGKK